MRKKIKRLIIVILLFAVTIPVVFANSDSKLNGENHQLMAVEDLFENEKWQEDWDKYLHTIQQV